MNRGEKGLGLERLRKGLDGRLKDLLLLVCLGVILVFSAWQIFHTEESSFSTTGTTEEELKVMRLLEEMEGVGEANVIVYAGEESEKNVVIVCEGAKDLYVVMQIREAVAAALGTEEKAVKIYLKK